MALFSLQSRREKLRDLSIDFTSMQSSDLHDGGVQAQSGHVFHDINYNPIPGANNNPGTFAISGGFLVSTATSNPPGNYFYTELGAAPSRIDIAFKLSGSSANINENGCPTIILAPDYAIGSAGTWAGGTGGAYNDMLHIPIGPWQTALEYLQNGIVRQMFAYTYPGGCLPIDNTTIYTATVYIPRRDMVIVKCPNGDTIKYVDKHIPQVLGPHMIYQHFTTVSPNLQILTKSITANVATRSPLGS